MSLRWLQFVLLLELDIFVVGAIVLFVLWIVYHYSVRSGYATLTYQAVPLHETILSRCTHIHNRYLGTPWLPTGDFLSVLATFFRSQPHPYTREQVEADDGALLNLDWLSPPDARAASPVMIVLPGITGHSKSGYLVHMVHGAYKHGWRVVVLVYPGTDLSKVKTARFIRSHTPSDLETTIAHVKGRYPKAPIYGVGYSMGAALLTKYLAHTGPKSKIKAAVSCSNPFDVLHSFKTVTKGLVNKLYNIHFLAALKKMYRQNETVFCEAFPHISPQEVAKIASVEEYDSKITMRHFGFDNLKEYYVSLGCKESVGDVSVPMLVGHARDDPIVPMDALPLSALKENKNIITMITSMGGHTGWLQGLNPMGPSWFDDVALEWIFNVEQMRQSGELADLMRADKSKKSRSNTVVTVTTDGSSGDVISEVRSETSPEEFALPASHQRKTSPPSPSSNRKVTSPTAGRKSQAKSPSASSSKKSSAKSPSAAKSPSGGYVSSLPSMSPKGRRTSRA